MNNKTVVIIACVTILFFVLLGISVMHNKTAVIPTGQNEYSNEPEQHEEHAHDWDEHETIGLVTPYIEVESVNAGPGDSEVKVGVLLHNNPGILGMTLSIVYDESALTLKDAISGEAMDTLTMTTPGKYMSQCRFIWDGEGITEDKVKDGEILVLFFDISDQALEKEYPIRFFCNEEDIVDNNLEPVPVTLFDGSIMVVK